MRYIFTSYVFPLRRNVVTTSKNETRYEYTLKQTEHARISSAINYFRELFDIFALCIPVEKVLYTSILSLLVDLVMNKAKIKIVFDIEPRRCLH